MIVHFFRILDPTRLFLISFTLQQLEQGSVDSGVINVGLGNILDSDYYCTYVLRILDIFNCHQLALSLRFLPHQNDLVKVLDDLRISAHKGIF